MFTMDVRITIHIDDGQTEIISLKGQNSLEDLIQEVSEATTFKGDHLKLYQHSDIDRERNLLKIWTDEEKKMTLKELGFQPGKDYQIDTDNYPEAANPRVKIETQTTWKILTSGGPMVIGPYSQGITLDRTSWMKQPRKLKLKVKFEQENDKYIRKFYFPENTGKIQLKCSEVGGVKSPLAFVNQVEVFGEDAPDAPDAPDAMGATPAESSNSKLETASQVAKFAHYGTGAVKNIAEMFFL